jgi:hypothetical protein
MGHRGHMGHVGHMGHMGHMGHVGLVTVPVQGEMFNFQLSKLNVQERTVIDST